MKTRTAMRLIVADAAAGNLKVLSKSSNGITLGLGQPVKVPAVNGNGFSEQYPKQLQWHPNGTWTYLYLSKGVPQKGEQFWVVVGEHANTTLEQREQNPSMERGVTMANYTIAQSNGRIVVLKKTPTRMNPKDAPPTIQMDLADFEARVSKPTIWRQKELSPQAIQKILGYDPQHPDNKLRAKDVNSADHGLKVFFEQALELVKQIHGQEVAKARATRPAEGEDSAHAQYTKSYTQYIDLRGQVTAYEQLETFLRSLDGDVRTTQRALSFTKDRREKASAQMEALRGQLREQGDTMKGRPAKTAHAVKARVPDTIRSKADISVFFRDLGLELLTTQAS